MKRGGEDGRRESHAGKRNGIRGLSITRGVVDILDL